MTRRASRRSSGSGRRRSDVVAAERRALALATRGPMIAATRNSPARAALFPTDVPMQATLRQLIRWCSLAFSSTLIATAAAQEADALLHAPLVVLPVNGPPFQK